MTRMNSFGGVLTQRPLNTPMDQRQSRCLGSFALNLVIFSYSLKGRP